MAYGKSMQGVSAYVEYHPEALFYYRQDKTCRYAHSTGVCINEESPCIGKSCVGYAQCTNWTPVNATRREENHARKENKKNRKEASKGKTKKKTEKPIVEATKTGGGYCIGDDPRHYKKC